MIKINSKKDYTSCVFIKQNSDKFFIGFSAIDTILGKCYFDQITIKTVDINSDFYKIINLIKSFEIGQIILNSQDNKLIKMIFEYCEDEDIKSIKNSSNFDEKSNNILLKNAFNIQSLLTSIEHLNLENYKFATKSLTVLIDFLNKKDNSCQKLSKPIKINNDDFVYMGNNPLFQLDIFNPLIQNSISFLYNNTKTAMGSRLLIYRLTHLIKDEERLKKRFHLTKVLFDYHKPIEKLLVDICDIEKLVRKISLKQLKKDDENILLDSLLKIKDLIVFMENYKFLTPPISSDDYSNILNCKLNLLDDKQCDILLEVSKFVALIDITISNIKTAKKYNLVAPKIVKTDDNNNFLEIINLRHLIVQNNKKTDKFIPNDIILGDLNLASDIYKENLIIKNSKYDNILDNKMNGVLLYGINSSGKSSLLKSIGISVCLAQGGFYVPASSMRFAIFDCIFTRISGSDDIGKGLSSFAVEMIQLQNILRYSTNRSLILGDEIGHGTETISAVSILASATLKLASLKPIFIFATHLHQLSTLEQIKKLKNVISLHLEIFYDKQNDKLIFDRKLKYGSGSSIYGLEFATSLRMDKEFLQLANTIRNNLDKNIF
jgi:DNA mismatch repair ATPase MutS